LSEDIDKITAMGYYDVYFAVDYDGMKLMRKLDGKCIFFKEGSCEIYERRPKRCQFNPMSYDIDSKSVVIHDSCRYKHRYEITKSGFNNMEEYIDRLEKEFELRKGIHHKSQRNNRF
jgi:Fe-S-cluster containining protein